MTTTKRGDMLLAISRVLLTISIGLTALGIAFVAVAIVVISFFPPADFAAQLAAAPPLALPMILVGAVIVLAILIMSIFFVLQLLRIIATVKNGDPFEPANADRLTRMGWYALGVTVAGWVAGGLGAWLTPYFKGTEVEVSPIGGLTLVLTLFILARVFRHGAAMRDDLIGTV